MYFSNGKYFGQYDPYPAKCFMSMIAKRFDFMFCMQGLMIVWDYGLNFTA